jgi:hypothetical protein
VAEKTIGRGSLLAGRFRLEDLVHENEGAKFWRATDRILARNVAVSVVDGTDHRAVGLLQAARTSATVTDGHFLRVLDAAEEDGVAYVVHEWGTGMSLDRMLEDGPLPPRRAAWLVKEVADAVATAHRNGVAHGRLLPENVMVTEAGSVKLIGFVVDAVLHGRPVTDESGRTVSEHETDVINLAALLYATLVTKWPGTPGSSVAPAPVEHGHVLRPRQVRAGIPRPLDAICERVLNPSDSSGATPIATAHEIGAALSDFIGDPAGIQLGLEPTTVLDREELRAATAGGAGKAGAAGAAGAATAAGAGATAGGNDPEATQAWAPATTRAEPAQQPEARAAEEPGGGAGPEPEGGARAERETAPDPVDTGELGATQAGVPAWHEPQRTDPAPPPPLADPEPKPLFAPEPPGGYGPGWRRGSRERDPAESGVTRTGGGTGSLPPVWGPDADVPADPQPGRRADRKPGRSWLQLAAVLASCLLLVLAVVVAFNLGRGSSPLGGAPEAEDSPSSEPSSSAPPEPVTIAAVDDFDPQSDTPEENSELAPLAVDGDPSTAWETMTYYNDPELGGLKDGVGLRLDLGKQVPVSAVRLTLQGEPTSLELMAAPRGASAPTSTDGLRTVAAQKGAGTQLTLRPDKPVTTRYLVVWLTSLPPVTGGYKGKVAEISVLS